MSHLSNWYNFYHLFRHERMFCSFFSPFSFFLSRFVAWKALTNIGLLWSMYGFGLSPHLPLQICWYSLENASGCFELDDFRLEATSLVEQFCVVKKIYDLEIEFLRENEINSQLRKGKGRNELKKFLVSLTVLSLKKRQIWKKSFVSRWNNVAFY